MAVNFVSSYGQNFDGLTATSWSNDVTLPGWFLFRQPAPGTAITSIAIGDGSSSSGTFYSYGTTGTSERALGGLGSGGAYYLSPPTGSAAGWIALALINTSGSALDALNIQFSGEQWRNGGNVNTQTMPLSWGIGSSFAAVTSWTTPGGSFSWTSPVASSTAGAVNGNTTGKVDSRGGTLTGLSWQPGTTLWLRWTETNDAGNDHGLAIDDVVITTAASPALLVTPSGCSTVVVEGGASSDSINLSLATNPTAPVTITLSGGDQLLLSGDGSTFAAGLNLVLSDTSNQSISVRAVDDALVEGDHIGNISVVLSSADTNYNGLLVSPLAVSVTDNHLAVVITPIHTIQGTGPSSPLLGQSVTVEGVVVASFPGSSGLSGFFVQEEDSDVDANSLSSEGIFVYDPTGLFDGNVGERVQLEGTVAEYTSSAAGITGSTVTSSLTQITSLTSLTKLGSAPLPTAATLMLPVADSLLFEALEGMAVTIGGAGGSLTVTNTFGLGRYGQVGLSADGRLSQFTQVNTPDVTANAAYLAGLSHRYIQLDDGSTRQNPDPVIHARGGLPLSALNPLRAGDTISTITGVLDHRFDGYRVQSASGANFVASNPRSITAPSVTGSLKVASFNLLNFFNGNGSGSAGTAGGFPTSRGADTLVEFERQQAKTVAAILSLDADIFAYNELENDGYDADSAAQQLLDGLNAALGFNGYSFITPSTPLLQPDGRFGGDEITVGFFYRNDRVRQAPDTTVAALQSGSFDQGVNRIQRPALAVSFERLSDGIGTGEQLTTVVTHLKSKGSSAGGSGDDDAGDGQGLSNGSRTRAAAELADWLTTQPTGSTDPDVLILGDLNSYMQEDPITTLASRGYQSLYGPGSYSYQFNGQWGSLDHMLASSSLAGQLGSATKWAINSDEAVVLDYNNEFKSSAQVTSFYNSDPFRSSDHDPLLAGFLLTPPPNTPPTAVALTNTTTNLAENTSTASGIKVADIVVTDDGLGTNTISLSGADAGSFEVDGAALYLKAGVALDYETQAGYGLTVSVIDESLTGSIPATTAYSLAVSNVNEAPTSSNATRTLAEDTFAGLGTADFGAFADGDGDVLAAVVITTLPVAGSLQFHDGSDWQAVVVNQSISVADLTAGKLRFAPAVNAAGSPYTSVGYKVSDGFALSDDTYTLSLDVSPSNDGSAAFAISGSAAVGETLSATQLNADPDGDGSSAFTFEWQSSADDSSWAVVNGNSVNYTITPADQGKQLRLQITYIDAQNFAEAITVAAGNVASGDTTVPLLEQLWAGPHQIVLRFSEAVRFSGDGFQPLPFTALVNGTPRAISSASFADADGNPASSGPLLLLNLTGDILDRAVSLSLAYSDPGAEVSGAITDLAGNRSASFDPQPISHYITPSSNNSLGLGVAYTALTLSGSNAIDGTGNGLDNTILGNDAANILDGRGGVDIMVGGLGDDSYIVDTALDQVIELAAGGTDTVRSSISWELGEHVEHLVLLGNGSINGTGNGLNNTISGTGGFNSLDGGAGADVLIGGQGNDTYTVDDGGDQVTELAAGGTDTVRSSINWSLGEQLENLVLLAGAITGTGNGLNNTITGNAADNLLDGGGGRDRLIGGAGHDTYVVDQITDTVVEQADEGIDTVISSVSWALGNHLEQLILSGSGPLSGVGNSLANTLQGNGGANILDGGAGGTDVLTGGGGADQFRFSSLPEQFSSAAADRITDFNPSEADRIRIHRSPFSISATTASLTSVAGAEAVATALGGSSLFVYDSSSGELHWNPNGALAGAGSGGVLAVLDNRASLTAGQITLV